MDDGMDLELDGNQELTRFNRSPTNFSDAVIQYLTTAGVSGQRAVAAVKRFEKELKEQVKEKNSNVLMLAEVFGRTSPDDFPAQALMSALQDAGGLSKYIRKSSLGLDERFDLVRDVTNGLDFLHSSNPPICHGDIKPNNIVVIPSGRAVVCDFGLTRDSSTPAALMASKSTDAVTRYLSPEICIDDKANKTLPSDVWAWACTVFEILTNSTPYSTAHGDGAILMAMIQGVAPGNPDSLLRLAPGTGEQDYGRALLHTSAYIRDSWSFDSSNRPSMSSLRRQLFKFLEKDATINALKSTMLQFGHLFIHSSRIAMVEGVELETGLDGEVVFAKLDESSQNPRDVTVKKFRVPATLNDRYRARLATRLETEIRIWGSVKHPNILELIGYCPDDRHGLPQFISPFMINGNVAQYISRVEPDLAVRLKLVQGLTAGLNHLHTSKPAICHGEVIPVNVLVSDNQDAVLCNFETAQFINEPILPSELTTPHWTEASKRYTSPELLGEDDVRRTLASDVWAWACTIFEILTDQMPYAEARGDIRFYQAINEGKPPGDLNLLSTLAVACQTSKADCASCLRLLHSYIRLCWDFDPRKRPQVSTLLQQLLVIRGKDASQTGLKLTLDELAHLLVQPQRITIIEGSELGAGNYGDVVLAKMDESSSMSRDVAVKQLRAVGTRGDRIRLVKRLARELNIWAKIKHPNVVELIGYYLDDKFEVPQLISAFMVNGNVLKYIQCAQPSIAMRLQFIRDITAGMACLHGFDQPICHGDLKPENVLISDDLTAVLCDFGLASFACGNGPVGLTTRSCGIKGTRQYMSPELHEDDDVKHTLASDVWAWGCTAFEILTGRIPYASAKGAVAFYAAIGRKAPPGDLDLLLSLNPPGTSQGCVDMLQFLHSSIRSCWDFDPSERPSTSFLLQKLSEFSLGAM